MSMQKQRFYSGLTEFQAITLELKTLLFSGDTDRILEKLNQRGAILADLQQKCASFLTTTDNKSESGLAIKSIIKSILNLDQENMEVAKKTLNDLSNSITELANEQKAIGSLRSIARRDQKQLVDFLY